MNTNTKPSKSACDKAIEILRLTKDGDDLDPLHLKLVESAVNGFLIEAGIEAFDKLHETVTNGKYEKPWFHGIEGLSIDHVGYVYWKGSLVENYDIPWAYTQEAEKEAHELARRCRIIENRGETPTNRNVIWDWDEKKEVPCTQ